MQCKRGGILMTVGLLLLLGAGVWGAANISFEEQGGEFAEQAVAKLLQIIPNQQSGDTTGTPLDEAGREESALANADVSVIETPQMQTAEIDGYAYIGVLSVPALKIELPVMSEWSYPLLKRSACRYVGSFLDDTLVIAGHSTRRHFRPLRQAQVGDSVVFTDVLGNVIQYQVVAIESLSPHDVEKLTTGDWDLTLFTCTPGGERRVTVRCNRVLS